MVDIGDEQSIEQSLSTFSSHMKNIIAITEIADQYSLVLLDELGAGTDPVEGAAIALGILDVLLERGVKVLVSSHMTPLKLYAYEKKELENASVMFNSDDLRPTFQLVVGLAGSSNALFISERLGLEKTIVERTKRFINQDVQRIDEVLNLLHQQKLEMETENARIHVLRAKLEQQQTIVEKQLEDIKQKKYGAFLKEIRAMEEELKEIQRFTQARVAQFKKDEQKSGEEFRAFNREVQSGIPAQLDRLKTKWEGVFSEEKREDELQKLNVGDFVLLKDSKLLLRIVEVKTDTVTVQKDNKRVEIPRSFISQKTKAPDENTRKEPDHDPVFTEGFASDRIDIRGKTVEEGSMIIDDFIGFLLTKNRKSGQIIHGKGTGKLAEGLWRKFASDNRIQSYRIGKPEEGGAGVTVIVLI